MPAATSTASAIIAIEAHSNAATSGPWKVNSQLPPLPSALGAASLSIAQRTYRTQLRLLEAGDLATFRATFLPGVEVTEAAFAACQAGIKAHHPVPDWAHSDEQWDAGHFVVVVSIIGPEPARFHGLDGRYLADSVWCAQKPTP
ncbi:MAG: hypothetical protein ACHREM_15200 [Polyangiales bacterium]